MRVHCASLLYRHHILKSFNAIIQLLHNANELIFWNPHMRTGPPADVNGSIITPSINSTTEQCGNGWVCEHRWLPIRNMIRFRNTVATAPVSSWWNNPWSGNQIAFCRGNRGFVAFNNDQYELKQKLFTCLPSGIYCDAITGEIRNDGKCSGTVVHIDENGKADISLKPDIGVLAIHIGVSREKQSISFTDSCEIILRKHF